MRDNLFRSDARARTAFVRNSTRTVPELIDNTISGGVQTLEGYGENIASPP